MPKKLDPPLKWHGGKQPLASWIVSLMPQHIHYVEPFAGSLAVLLARDPEDVSEVVNDISGDLTDFWRVVQQPETFERFRRVVEAMPFSEIEWQDARDRLKGDQAADAVERAVAFFIFCRQSLAGRMDTFAPLSRTRIRRNRNEQVSAWQTTVKDLPAVHARLMRVAIRNRPAVEVIRSEDGPGTLLYCDPPYLHPTRQAADVYAHEMSEADHRQLLQVLRACKSKVMLSGYPSEVYAEDLAGWRCEVKDVANHAAGGQSKRRMQECLWCNF